MQQDDTLTEIKEKVLQINPCPLNYWEVTAIIESLGYNDQLVQAKFGFPNVLMLAQDIYQELTFNKFPEEQIKNISYREVFKKEIYIFLEQFSHSFIYAFPWIAMFLFEQSNFNNSFFVLPTNLAAPLSLALMMSLIVSGGFIQIIARQGQIYLNLGEKELAKKACSQFIIMGLSLSIIIGFLGLLFGFYRSLFPDQYLIIAVVYYLLLSLIWMLCSVISLEKPVWYIPLIFILSSLLFVGLAYLKIEILISQIIAIVFSLILILILIEKRFNFIKGKVEDDAQMQMPRFALLFYSLAPYFFYGITYFSFLFADRLTAGSTISFSSGLSFSINADYKKGMDLALLNFLVSIAFTEYLHYKFMHYWYKEAETVFINNTKDLSKRLYQHYLLIITLIFFIYLVSGSLTILYFSKYGLSLKVSKISIIGLLSYFIFTVGLLNSMILFSLAKPSLVLKAIVPGLLINLLLGYLFGHIFYDSYVLIGFILGTLFFAIYSLKDVLSILSRPDYAYYAS